MVRDSSLVKANLYLSSSSKEEGRSLLNDRRHQIRITGTMATFRESHLTSEWIIWQPWPTSLLK
jgi:hypothetical protein